MNLQRVAILAFILAAFASFAPPAASQEVVVSARPGLGSVTVFTAPGGGQSGPAQASELINRPVTGRQGEWVQVGFPWGAGWVAGSDILVRGKPSANRSGPQDVFRGATEGGRPPR